ncbi:MAG TPA: hypothetical protein P5563_01795 [Saprospiraceae bacterium]|nr:hypothetical protein [Saprospiraceae bacterium]
MVIALDKSYQDALDDLIQQIQASEELATYLETEEEEAYQALREVYEGLLAELYRMVAVNDPLQITSLEVAMLDERLEGLYLPKILGFSVLRGAITDDYRYYYPQEQFKTILLAICHSSNFEWIRKRTGQNIQIGFGLSSDIWVTNLIQEISNKKIRQFLEAQKIERYHDLEPRRDAYRRYAGQFRDEIFFTADFPTNLPDLKRYFPSLRNFLGRRIQLDLNNESILEPIYDLVRNKEFQGAYEHNYLLAMFLNFFDAPEESKKQAGNIFNQLRKQDPEFNEHYFGILTELHHSQYEVSSGSDRQVASIVDSKIKDDIADYYALIELVHSKGYVHQDAIEAIQQFYGQHQGVSKVNECVRLTVFRQLRKFIANLEPADYPELFEISKIYAAYFQIFDNEHFKQDVKDLNMAYVKKLIKTFTDKRGKDYQDIKRFVQATFTDLGFLTDKEVVELFKSRRKKKAVAEE